MGEWFVKKLVRLLPSLWVFMLFSLAVDTYTGQTAGFQWFNWVYPTPYWFINAIICFFLVSWIINKINKRKNILGGWLISSVLILHVLWYCFFVDHDRISLDDGEFKCWFYFFAIFLWGYYMKANEKPGSSKGRVLMALGFPIMICAFFAFKKNAERHGALINLQVVAIPVLLALIVYTSRHLALLVFNARLPQWLKSIMVMMSNLTLDIYIVQMFFIDRLMPTMPFPLNVLVTLCVIFIASIINKNIADRIAKAIL